MRHRRALVQLVTLLAASVASAGLLPESAEADARLVNCGAGRRIASALRLPAGRQLTITVQGTCTENFVVTRDDVTIQGAPGASIAAADAGQATILIDGARRVRIQSLTVTGGEGAIVGTNHALFEVVNVTAQGGTRYGIIASYGAIGTIDGSTIQNVNGDGVSASNNASIIVTNSAVQNNTGVGISGSRNAHVRIGQDRHGSTTLKPVTIVSNGSNGVSINQSSAGIIVGGSVSGNGSSNIFVGRGSGASIGFGVQSLIGAITIQNGRSNGMSIEGGNATILNATISGNAKRGIVVTNGGSARIGIKNDNSGYAANSISGNGGNGIHVSTSSSALVGGTTISGNGTDASQARYGVYVGHASVNLAGNNIIENNPASGVFVRAGNAVIGDGSFGLPVDNTIRGNGSVGGDRAGVYAFQGGGIQVYGATITGNTGAGAQAFENGVLEFRDGTVISANVAVAGVSADDFNAGHGVAASFNSTANLRDAGTAVQNNPGHGVMVSSGSVVRLRIPPSGTAPVSVTGNTGFGLKCFTATNYSGDVTGVTNNTGGGNVDPATGNISGCSRF